VYNISVIVHVFADHQWGSQGNFPLPEIAVMCTFITWAFKLPVDKI